MKLDDKLYIIEMGSFCRYAFEGIKAACDWAYKGVSEGSVLEGKQQIVLKLLCTFTIHSYI